MKFPPLTFTRKSFVQEQPFKQQGMSISGYQPKLSLTLNDKKEFEVVETLGQYILKPSPEAFPYLAENEYASMQVMKMLGFEIPDFGLTSFLPDEKGVQEFVFIIKRYDRTLKGGKIHQEQLDAAMGIGDKYGKIQGDDFQYISYEQIGRYLVEHLDASLAFKRDFYLRVVASYMIGNNDLHLRNFGILYPQNESPRLAPVYDYVSVIPYPEYHSDYLALPLLIKQEGDGELADGFNTVFGQYIGYDFIEFGVGIGLSEKAAKKYLFDILNKSSQIAQVYKESAVSGKQLDMILSCIKQRTKCLSEIHYNPL